jgi:hypothetical protein
MSSKLLRLPGPFGAIRRSVSIRSACYATRAVARGLCLKPAAGDCGGALGAALAIYHLYADRRPLVVRYTEPA